MRHLDLESRIGGYEAADLQAASIGGFYPAVAALIGAQPHQIAFASSATNAFARALSSVPFRPGDSVLIASEDYISNQLALLSMCRRLGIRLLRAPMTADGGVDLDAFREMAKRHQPRLVSLTHVPTNSGLVQPAEEVGRICREIDAVYLLDACQSAGQLPLDVRGLRCDFLSATFRKFLRGPRGAGFLFASDRVLQEDFTPLFIDMRAADWTDDDVFRIQPTAKRFEDWEMPYALVEGGKEAARYATALDSSGIQKVLHRLTETLQASLQDIGLQTFDPTGRRCAIVTTTLPGKSPEATLHRLRDQGINASISYRSYALPDMKRKNLDWVLRLSPHYYNTEEEIRTAADCLREWMKD